MKTTATDVCKIKVKKLHNSIYKKVRIMREKRINMNFGLYLILFYSGAKLMSSTHEKV